MILRKRLFMKEPVKNLHKLISNCNRKLRENGETKITVKLTIYGAKMDL